MTALTITKLDVLQGIDPLRVAVRYRSKEGAIFDRFPYHQSILHSATPIYEDLPGFDADVEGCRSEGELPPQARAYLNYISEFVGVPIRLVGVGPDREQVVWIGDEPRLQAA
jgi:adenylosuccinate synthase